jgi:hypothetical protein
VVANIMSFLRHNKTFLKEKKAKRILFKFVHAFNPRYW